MAIESFQQLEVWRHGHELVLKVYRGTRTLPSEERYGLVAQRRRAAVSVPANIAEGFKRRTKADKRHFYNIAQASLEEVRYYFILCRDLGYRLDSTSLSADAERVARMPHGLVKAVSG